ncbi:MBL fold metallo-hydrolase [Clostridium cellulovorans]|uniref:Beta-lactamase domain protein n=1 Tax=Clostridium cellulovorans (strain ATCC 35296 / DSM 3052 / OCM 3 / 743B) TaxID=573061 RepID=D9SQF3_CLOC7|nr:MBL fold metallo-hydrolase [Clostridium cellulovorans]ADL50220.1 beta-lactamase domain protein [Clostridium cellulovorans 743B]
MEASNMKVINKAGITIHISSSPLDGEKVNSIIVESQNKLVVIDVPLLRPYSKDFRAYANQLGKPIDRVIITHAHPDHWAGLEAFEDLPIYSLSETQEEIQENGEWMLTYHRSLHGDLITDKKIVPNNIIEEGKLIIDSVEYNAIKVTEAEYKHLLVLELPRIKTLISQDMVYNKVYLFLGELTSTGELACDNWIDELKKYKEKNYEVVIPGHGEPTDSSIIDENINYIIEAKGIIKTSKDSDEFKNRMIEKFPDYEIPLMLDMTAYFIYMQNK